MTVSRLCRVLAAASAVLLAASCASNATSGAAASGSGSIVIGTSISLSGNTVLASIRDGYQFAIDQANASGGITVNGVKRKVQLDVLDNRSDTSTMVQQVRTLVLTDHAVALLGSCCQQNIDMQGQADALKTPLVIGALPVELLPKGQGYTWDSFQSLTDGATEFYQLADTAGTNKKVLLVTNNDAQGGSTAQLWSGLGKKSGFTIAATKAVPAGTTDFSNVIQAGQSSGAQILITSMTPPDCFALWKQMKALAYSPKLAIGLQCAQTPGWASLGSLGNGTLVQLNWTETSGLPDAQLIIDKFAKKYPALNDLGSVALGYHEAQILLDAISRSGTASSAAIQTALASSDVTSALGEVHFVSNKSVTPSYIGQWENGTIQQVWPAKGAVALQSLSGLS
ncbi:MAG TPA: ABC transporter substrate-binding protein [Actinospica sp.]|nr:ABC transporter substrate-binding protein [Actinospica sp.]